MKHFQFHSTYKFNINTSAIMMLVFRADTHSMIVMCSYANTKLVEHDIHPSTCSDGLVFDAVDIVCCLFLAILTMRHVCCSKHMYKLCHLLFHMNLSMTWLLKKFRDLIILFYCSVHLYSNLQVTYTNLVFFNSKQQKVFFNSKLYHLTFHPVKYIYVLCIKLYYRSKFLWRKNDFFLQTWLFWNSTIVVGGAANNFVYNLVTIRAPTMLVTFALENSPTWSFSLLILGEFYLFFMKKWDMIFF